MDENTKAAISAAMNGTQEPKSRDVQKKSGTARRAKPRKSGTICTLKDQKLRKMCENAQDRDGCKKTTLDGECSYQLEATK
jgi:hypothetical protein